MRGQTRNTSINDLTHMSANESAFLTNNKYESTSKLTVADSGHIPTNRNQRRGKQRLSIDFKDPNDFDDFVDSEITPTKNKNNK